MRTHVKAAIISAYLALICIAVLSINTLSDAYHHGIHINVTMPPRSSAPPRTKHTAVEYAVIIKRDIFNPPKPLEVPPPPVPLPPLSAKLLGTAETVDGERVAVIEDAGVDGAQKLYRCGDVISGRLVTSIERDRILLNGGDFDEILNSPLPIDDVLAIAMGRRAPRAANGGGTILQTVKVSAQTSGGIEIADLVPHVDGTGIVGLRVESTARSTILQNIGIEPGDVVVAINGSPADDPLGTMAVVQKLDATKPISLDVLRGGERIALKAQPPEAMENATGSVARARVSNHGSDAASSRRSKSVAA
jgi:type II secretory pathway component PulC